VAVKVVRAFALAIIGTIVVAACGSTLAYAPIIDDSVAVQPVATPTATPTPIPAPSPAPLYSKLRIFVASESTD